MSFASSSHAASAPSHPPYWSGSTLLRPRWMDTPRPPCPDGCPPGSPPDASAAQVFGPTMPSTPKPCAFSNRGTAASVFAPKMPSAPPGSKPAALSCCCNFTTSGPWTLPQGRLTCHGPASSCAHHVTVLTSGAWDTAILGVTRCPRDQGSPAQPFGYGARPARAAPTRNQAQRRVAIVLVRTPDAHHRRAPPCGGGHRASPRQQHARCTRFGRHQEQAVDVVANSIDPASSMAQAAPM